MGETNWAGTYTYGAGKLHRPSTLEQVRHIVASAPRLRVLGSRHSFTGIADSSELLSLDGLPEDAVVDHAARTVSVSPGIRYGQLAQTLNAQGVALHNLASLPHISVAGAVATATHGSGDANGNLATAVADLELVTSSGDIVTASRGDADFHGIVVGLGALGAVTRLTLDIEPAYYVSQRVYEDLSWDALFDHFGEITASGTSVSLFTRWSDSVDQVWVKNRVAAAPERDDLWGAIPSKVDRHPVFGRDPANCSQQLGVPGLWSDRLPHFRMGFTPGAGEEIQSEYFLPRRHAVAAIQAMRVVGDRIRSPLQVCEIRTIAADQLWMSPQYKQDTIAIHFSWTRDQASVERALVEVEAALSSLEARPHWGKLFLQDAASIAALYERLPDFAGLARRLDPRGAFRNAWLERHVLGVR